MTSGNVAPAAAAQWQGGLPSRWPSAWPSLAGRVALGCVVPVAAAAVAYAVVAIVGIVSTAWWVALLPLLLLAWPLTLPSRVRSAVQKASDAKSLLVTVAPLGLLVRVPGRGGRRRRAAEVPTRGAVRYSV